MIRAPYYLLAAVGILATIAYAAHEVQRGDMLPLFIAIVLHFIYAATFAADYLMRCWRAGR